MISRDEWLKAVDEANAAPLEQSDALTVVELAGLFGMQRSGAQGRVDKLIAAGKAERVTKRIRMRNGAIRTVPAYRLIQ